MHSYSIVYLDAKRNYYIISDVNCASRLYPLNLLFGNLKEEEITVHTEAIKEEIVVIEEEEEQEEEREIQYEEENLLDKLEEEKADFIEEEKDNFFEEEKVVLVEEEKTNLFEEENFNFFEEEKTNFIEEEKTILIEEENVDFFEEEKTNYFEEEKIDIYEEEKEDLIKEEEKIKELEKEEETIKEEFEEEKEEEKEDEKEIKYCEQLEKCLLCNEESISQNLCIKCNNLKNYYFLNINSIPKEEINDQYIDCVNEETKPDKFYFDSETEDYKPCYHSCATCDKGGNHKTHNCKTCEKNYISKPDTTPTTNCVIKCPSYYYYSINNQYKCTEDEYCPLNYILLVKEKGKCSNDCKKDDTYKYQYDNQCLKECPDSTITDNDNFLCKDKDINISVLTETNHTFFDKNFTDEEIAQLVENYMQNFYYTNNHISTYKSNNFSIAIYKNGETISNLSLSIPKIDFENCYTKIKEEHNINDDLIIVLESEKVDKENDKIISFSVYDPRNGRKIIFNDLCLNDSIIVQEELGSKIPNLDSFIYLTNQGIDLLNPNSDFYTDLCFHFKSPYDGKDVPLKERFELFFPNVSLCEKGCSIKGINGTTNTSICECTLNNLINNDIIGGNIFFQSAMAEVKTLLQETNIEILRCYKDLFHIEFYVSNYGSFILLGLLLIQIILTIIYYKKFIFSMRKYLFNLSQTYLLYLSKKAIPHLNQKDFEIKNKLIQIKANPHKKSSKNVTKMNDISNNDSTSIPNSNTNLQKRNNILNINNKIKPRNSEDIKLSNDDLIIHKKEEKGKNSLIIGNITEKEIEDYIKTDPDDMDYDNAIGRDKRTFCEYICENIKTDLLILNIFCNYEQLIPWPIKFLLFILNVDLYFFVNGLFFSEDYLDEMLYDKNVNLFDFISRFIDRIYYITLIGIIISYVSNCFFFEERIVKKLFKREKNNLLILEYEMAQIIKNIKSRYNIFIIICFIAAIFIWYYSFCFNNIYPSMKKEWIITSVITIFVMQAFYFLKLLLESIIRFIAIKCKSERLFKISQFLS